MKKFICLFLLPFLFGSGVFAQQTAPKTGWKVSPFPAVGYDSNNGLQYGVFGDVYNYGDGATYPDPLQKFTFEVSHFTKGRSRLRLSFDSKYLIPRMRLTLSAIYCLDPLYQFYGFNGAAEPYVAEQNAKDAGLRYNSMRRSYFQGLANFQGTITGHLNWAAGATFWHYRTETFDGDKFGADASRTLYNEYVRLGLIGEKEKAGGNVLELRAGLAYNSRDVEAAPNKGINADLFLNGAPDLAGTGHGYLRLCANFAQFISIPVGFIAAGDPVFAYHVGLQHTWGDAPFYIHRGRFRLGQRGAARQARALPHRQGRLLPGHQPVLRLRRDHQALPPGADGGSARQARGRAAQGRAAGHDVGRHRPQAGLERELHPLPGSGPQPQPDGNGRQALDEHHHQLLLLILPGSDTGPAGVDACRFFCALQ